MTDPKPASGQSDEADPPKLTFGDILGEDKIRALFKAAGAEHKVEYNALHSRAKDGDKLLAYNQRTHFAITRMLRQLRLIQDMHVAALLKIIEKQADRIAALEQRKAMSWHGVWRREETYAPGAVCTDRGSAWVAQIETRGMRPGEGNVFWKLIDKRNAK